MATFCPFSITIFNGLDKGLSYPITKSLVVTTKRPVPEASLNLKLGFTCSDGLSSITILSKIRCLDLARLVVATRALFLAIKVSSFSISFCCFS